MKKEKVLEKMTESKLLMKNEMTPEQYREELFDFQKMLAKIVFGKEMEKGAKYNDMVCELEARARKRGVINDPEFRKGINSLNELGKETAIVTAGRNGEGRVSYALKRVQRSDCSVYSNVYLTDGVDETEVDKVIVTRAGILLVEVKATKRDITISEEGKLLYGNSDSYRSSDLKEKMNRQRSLFTKELKRRLEGRGYDIPVHLESYVVFAPPKDCRIIITDNYKKEKYCFYGKLPFIVDEFQSRRCFSEEELIQVKRAVRDMGRQCKTFIPSLDFNETRMNIAAAIEMVTERRFSFRLPFSKRRDDSQPVHNTNKYETQRMQNTGKAIEMAGRSAAVATAIAMFTARRMW